LLIVLTNQSNFVVGCLVFCCIDDQSNIVIGCLLFVAGSYDYQSNVVVGCIDN